MKFLIKESKLKETIIDSIDKDGLLHTLKLTSMSFTKLFSIIGMDYLTNKIMIQFIKDVIDKNGSFSVYDFYINPIPYNKTDSEYREISYFGPKFAAVDVYSENGLLGDFHVRYENLDDDKLMEVFDLVMEAYEDGKLDVK